MAHSNTLFQKVHHEISRHIFEGTEKRYFQKGDARKFSTKNLFTFWLFVHITQAKSLRSVISSLTFYSDRLYHLGISNKLKRSTISDAIGKRTYKFFEDLFYTELSLTKRKFRNKFSFPLRILDATEVVIQHTKFSWGDFKHKTNMFKVHVEICGMNYLPLSVDISSGKIADITHAKHKQYEAGTILLMDRAYCDTKWWRKLNENGVIFITRLKKNINFMTLKTTKLDKEDLMEEKVIQFMGETSGQYGEHLRCITILDKTKNTTFDIITNDFNLPATSIAELYKHRWQIELFFKWIKQKLKIKNFIGMNSNAMLMQIWTALLTYLLIWRMHQQSEFKEQAILEFLRYLQTRLLLPDIALQLLPKKKKIPIQPLLFKET